MAYSTKKKTDELVAKLQKQLGKTPSNQSHAANRIKRRISKLRSEEAARKAERTKPGYKGNRYGYKAIEGPRVALTGEKDAMQKVSPKGTSGKTARDSDSGSYRKRPGAAKPKVSKPKVSKPKASTPPPPTKRQAERDAETDRKVKRSMKQARRAARRADSAPADDLRFWAPKGSLSPASSPKSKGWKKEMKKEIKKARKLDHRLAQRNRTLGVRS